MLKWLQKTEKTTTLLHLISIVWKQFVLHVVLLWLWPCLTSLNLLQKFLPGWKMCILHQICDQTISALTKHVWSFKLLSAMAFWIFGKRHLTLWFILIIISIIEPVTTFVANGAILHPTLSLWQMMQMVIHIINMLLILRCVLCLNLQMPIFTCYVSRHVNS